MGVRGSVHQFYNALTESLRIGKFEVRLARFVEETLSTSQYERIDE